LGDLRIIEIFQKLGLQNVSADEFKNTVVSSLDLKKRVEKLGKWVEDKKFTAYADTVRAELFPVTVDAPAVAVVNVEIIPVVIVPPAAPEKPATTVVPAPPVQAPVEKVNKALVGKFQGLSSKNLNAAHEREDDGLTLRFAAKHLKDLKHVDLQKALLNMSDELFENKDVEATDENITTIVKAIEQSVEPRILEGLLDFLRKLVGKRADKDKFAEQIKAAQQKSTKALSEGLSNGLPATSALEVLTATNGNSERKAPKCLLEVLKQVQKPKYTNEKLAEILSMAAEQFTDVADGESLSTEDCKLLDYINEKIRNGESLGVSDANIEAPRAAIAKAIKIAEALKEKIKTSDMLGPLHAVREKFEDANQKPSSLLDSLAAEWRRRLGATEKDAEAAAVRPVDQVVVRLYVEAEKLVKNLKIENIKDQKTFQQFKTDLNKAETKINNAETVLKMNKDVESRTAEVKKTRATALGLGLGLGLGLPALAAVVFTVLVKTNRLLLNFGAPAVAHSEV